MTDVEPDSFTLRWSYRVGEDGPAERLEQFAPVSAIVAEYAVRLDVLRREIVGRLAEAGLSRQAIGDMLVVPRQRIDGLNDAP